MLDNRFVILGSLQTLLSTAISNLTNGAGAGPGSADLVFGGDNAKWIRVAWTLKARYYMETAESLTATGSSAAYTSAITASNNSLTANGANTTHERIFVANWDSSISNSTINNFRYQWSRDLEVTTANGSAPGSAPAPGMAPDSVIGWGLAIAGQAQAVTATEDRLHDPRIARIGLDLAAQVLDVRVHGPLIPLELVPADPVDQLEP